MQFSEALVKLNQEGLELLTHLELILYLVLGRGYTLSQPHRVVDHQDVRELCP